MMTTNSCAAHAVYREARRRMKISARAGRHATPCSNSAVSGCCSADGS
jgi:hypothetical protein